MENINNDKEVLRLIYGEVRGLKATMSGKVDTRECENHRDCCEKKRDERSGRSVGWLITIICCIATAVTSISTTLIIPKVKDYVLDQKPETRKVVNK